MTGEDLYIEEQCPQCGQKKLKNASFCPHCGYVKKKGWLDSLGELFGRRGDSGGSGSALKGPTFPVVMGLLFAGYLVYTAIEEGSVQSLIMALLVLFAVLQSWLTGKKKPSGDHQEGKAEKEENLAPSDKFFCENCSTEVDASASQCPKCGMKFG